MGISTAVLAAYVATCILLAVTPGPNMALIVSATLSGGFRAGLLTLAGTLTGLSIIVAIAAIGMTSVMVLMAEWFDVVRWVGAVYLIYLGARQLWAYWRGSAAATRLAEVSGQSRYMRGLLVALSNPKVLLFLGAFLPQFVSTDAPPGPQLAVLAVLFVVILGAVDLSYTWLVARARQSIDMQRLRVLDGIAGALLVAGGLVLVAARRP
jgi:threonine/homoserine/homoserine lactone efflux protein